MSSIRELADEIAALPANTAFRLTPTAQHAIVGALRLVEPTDKAMAYLGHYGNISPKSELIDAVMNALDAVETPHG